MTEVWARTVWCDSPPHAETDESEDDDDDGGHAGPDGDGQDLPVNLTLVPVEIARAGALSLAPPDGALPPPRAELGRAGLTEPAGQLWVRLVLVTVTLQALAGEPPEEVDTEAEVPAVVVLRLAALVEVLHPGDGVEGPRDIKIAAADIVCSGLDDFYQLVLDVPLDDLRSGVAVLLHLQGGVHRDGPVEREELVYFGSQVNIREGCERHRRADLEITRF